MLNDCEKLTKLDDSKSYVYRYTDLNDSIIKYVGIVNKGTLVGRNKQHMREDWYKNGEFMLEYIEVPNQSTAEAIESHLIALYGTDKWYNKAKAGWGLIEYFPKEFDWQVANYTIDEILNDMNFILNLKAEKSEKKIDIERIREYIADIRHCEKVRKVRNDE